MFSGPLARWIDSFGELKRHVVGVVHNVPDREDCGRALKVEVS